MSSIKVVDVNDNEEDKQEEPTEQIEEAKEEEQVNEVVEEPAIEQEAKTEEVEESKEVLQVEKKVSPQNKLVRCPKCNREMKLKSYRYGHEQKCQGTLEQKPVKPFSKPRATPKPKAQPVIREVEVEEEVIEQREALPVGNPKPKTKLTQEVSNQILKPSNPLADLTNHYQLLQNQYIQQKKENIIIYVKICLLQNLKKGDIIIFYLSLYHYG